AQLYTLRDFLKTPDDVAGTLEKVKKIGYDAVQISGVGPIDEELLLRYANDNGLVICATHEGSAKIFDETSEVISRLKKLSCKHTAYPHPHYMPRTHHGAVMFARKLNEAAEKMAKEGQILSYHNHATEFVKYDGEFFLDILYREAPLLHGELDTFWVQAGGQDPAKWIKKLAGRQYLLHLKDYGMNFAYERVMLPIGSGNLYWDEIMDAAKQAGVEYYIVEQDNCNGMDPFDALASSYRFISEKFFE
ncbi:MAG: sugar phosphate isomerase/epimerase, partial [Lentisphaeria bacterium]|nr:sugar phosphate isomerase/epimerase [Lentisphaeria bacterium]